MGIVSYAQNFEDVLLWRALGHIENGCYVDIGAHDPIVDSVSKAFYERGWRGVHVEPLPVYCDALRRDRPDETVLQAAVAAETGVLRFYEIPDTGISTGDEVIALSHRERGFRINENTVPCVTLAQVFELVQGDVVHWLKIDVEGLEEQVLQGWGASSLRPWIVVVESTLPLTQDEVFGAWEGLLIEKGYRCVHFDGLNRYYLAEGKSELESAFRSGPNVFDNFQFNGTASNTFTQHVSQSIRNELNSQIDSLKQQTLQHHNGEQNCATRLAEELAHSESLKQTLQAEQTANLQNQNAAKALAFQFEQQARRETEALLRMATQREQEFTAQLLAAKDQLQQLEQARSAREKQLQEQLAQAEQQARQDIEAQLRTAMQREQEFTVQLLAAKDQLQQLENEHRSRQSDLLERLAEIERQSRLESEAHFRNALEREQAVAEQLLGLQQQAAQALAQQASQLQSQHDERRLAWESTEKTLHQEIANLANEVQALRHANERQTQQHGFAMDAHLGEHQRLIEAYAALESRLKGEIEAEQQTNMRLRQALTEVQQALAETQASLTWQLMAPLRAIFFLFSLKQSNRRLIAAEHETNALSLASQSPSINIQSSSPEPIMPSLLTATPSMSITTATTLDELMAYHDQSFVVCAYHTLLGREPDPEGLGYYLSRLRTGIPKIQMLAQLRLSKEGQAYIHKVPGLDAAIRRYQMGLYPLIGWLFRRVDGGDGNHLTERKLRCIENQLFLFNKDAKERFDKIDNSLSLLRGMLSSQSATISHLASCSISQPSVEFSDNCCDSNNSSNSSFDWSIPNEERFFENLISEIEIKKIK